MDIHIRTTAAMHHTSSQAAARWREYSQIISNSDTSSAHCGQHNRIFSGNSSACSPPFAKIILSPSSPFNNNFRNDASSNNSPNETQSLLPTSTVHRTVSNHIHLPGKPKSRSHPCAFPCAIQYPQAFQPIIESLYTLLLCPAQAHKPCYSRQTRPPLGIR